MSECGKSSEAREQPLLKLDGHDINAIVATMPGGRANVQDIYPLSSLQEGMLFHHLLNEKNDTYVLSTLFEMNSHTHVKSFIEALSRVIDRNEMLRSAVLWEQLPRPVQVVHRKVQIPVEELVLRPEVPALDQMIKQMQPIERWMDVRRAPLLRLQVAADPSLSRWYVLLRVHHLICDHHSLSALVEELMTYIEGRWHALPDPMSLRSYLSEMHQGHNAQASEEFFRLALAEVTEPTAPFGLMNVHGDGAHVQECREALSSAITACARRQALRLGVSVARLFHAAWSLVVAHTSNRDDVVFGTVILAGRSARSNGSKAFGMSVNTLPLRLRLGRLSCLELVEQVQSELQQLLCHEHASLATAQRVSGIATGMPLFTTILNCRRSLVQATSGLRGTSGIKVLRQGEAWSNYPVAFTVDDRGGEFLLIAQTDRRIDAGRVIRYMVAAIQALVDALEHRPTYPALALPIFEDCERHQVLESFNATKLDFVKDRLIHQVFEERVAQAPDRVALNYEGRAVTYRELDARANQLARHLRTRGVGPDVMVALCLRRSSEMVIGLLAILKAGGAYVPLDPDYPADRLAWMVRDAAPKVLLTQTELREVVPASLVERIEIDHHSGVIEEYSTDKLSSCALGLSSGSLAYVIYTSGSTGEPKGVMIDHSSVINLWQGLEKSYRQPQILERVALNASLSFDASVQQLVHLLMGRSLFVVPGESRRDASLLVAFVDHYQIDAIDCTPSQLKGWVMAGLFEIDHRPRVVLVGGEAIERSMWTRLSECSGTEFMNVYGPTECTVDATLAHLRGDEGSPHIGKPMGNRRAYILGPYGTPSPVGVPGEICIGGMGVARGYLNRPALTAEKFVADPFSREAGARMYRTGDLGKWLETGTIEYLGRNDHQVKVRGFRIELGEIETQLAGHELIGNAVVMVREDIPEQKRLVAYISPRGERVPTVDELRRYMMAALPRHMVPSAYVLLESMPTTASGKLDRRALPAPGLAVYENSQYERPRGEVEEILAQIWQELLQVERVGREDSFFELGGHSLLVLSALSRINQSFGCVVKVTDIYRSPTVRELAARICGDDGHDDLINLTRESMLEVPVDVKAWYHDAPPKGILLTGATGFVGRFLLDQLIQHTDAHIYCLVRAPSQQDASLRLRETLVRWGLWPADAEQRIAAIPGDLRIPKLGIDDSTYEFLAQSIDSIYHCATSMNHLETYAMAKSANVDSAKEIVRLAADKRLKLINYVSTLDVFATTGCSRVISETSSIEHERHSITSGYAGSKWVAEKIFMNAGELGIPTNIFRLGLAWADTQQGRYDELQREYRMLKSCLISGFGIEMYSYETAPTPVDYMASAIVLLSLRRRLGGSAFHIASPKQSVHGLFERLNAFSDAPLPLMKYFDWIQNIKRLHHNGQSLPVVPLVECSFSMTEAAFDEYQQSIRSSTIRFEDTATARELELANLSPPRFDDGLIRLCIDGIISGDTELREIVNCKLTMAQAMGNRA